MKYAKYISKPVFKERNSIYTKSKKKNQICFNLNNKLIKKKGKSLLFERIYWIKLFSFQIRVAFKAIHSTSNNLFGNFFNLFQNSEFLPRTIFNYEI